MSFVFAHPLLGPDSPIGAADQALIAGLMTEEENAPHTRRWTAAGMRLALDHLHGQIADILGGGGPTLDPMPPRSIRKAYLVGTCAALAAAQGLRPLFEEMLGGTPCEAIDSTDFAYYARQAVNADCLVIVLAATETPWRSLEATLAARALGAFTLVLTAGGDAQYDQYGHAVWRLGAPADPIADPSLLLAMAYRLGLALGELNGVAAARLAQLGAALAAMPRQLEQCLIPTDADRAFAARLEMAGHIIVVGNGAARAAAAASADWIGAVLGRPVTQCGLEALGEIPANPSIATLVIAPNGLSVRRAQLVLGRRQGDGAMGLVVADDSPLATLDAGTVFRLPAMIERLSALVYLSVGQRIACALAERRQP
ncbi:phosphoheptose isomerase family protein [Devosia faecipullorum]|uniref:hypothetical protein n=1 Tax=Devosia faecipullorum TaxID=2755039 RepID=UPI00187B3FC5|nr:hypothetical protein [Devosia faecipullorum]MBE7734072.1 hypothetical protein [Devosia faecipullorum]